MMESHWELGKKAFERESSGSVSMNKAPRADCTTAFILRLAVHRYTVWAPEVVVCRWQQGLAVQSSTDLVTSMNCANAGTSRWMSQPLPAP